MEGSLPPWQLGRRSRSFLAVVRQLEKVAKKEMKVRVPHAAGLARFFFGPVGRWVVIGVSLVSILVLTVFIHFYSMYAQLMDEKLRLGVFANTAKIFATPQSVAVGDPLGPEDIAEDLRRSGYGESRSNPDGYYRLHPNAIEIFPGPNSYFDQEAGLIRFSGGRISSIVSLQDNTARHEYSLEPQLITALSGPNREKRRMVKFSDIPKVMVDAVTSAEDKHFFQHAGFDPSRIIKAAYIDLKQGKKEQGASTLSQQLARMLWLNEDKRWKRKLAEMMITLELEQRLSKEEIFEDYANDIYLGSRGSFRIHGFGEASEAFLGKDLGQITLPEAAELAGMIQNPAHFDPFRHPDRVKERRNLVLFMMRQNGYINDRDYALAMDAPVVVPKGAAQVQEAPYFVDMVNDAVQARFLAADLQTNAFRLYTTLDMRLQKAAAEAIRLGMQNVDDQIKRQRRFRGQTPPEPQVALVALDPHTGEVRALAGGRNYGVSQLNHVLAKRQPGSIFKPFVYAAAMDTAINGSQHVLTPSTMVDDEPTTFWFDGKPYEPSNFGHEFHGHVTLRDALAHSMNVATVKVAEMIGFDQVVEMANRAGMNYRIRATPAVALGAYEITPIEAAGAYTMFANHGVYVKPSFIDMVRTDKGQVLYKNAIEKKQVLDPRVAYVMTNMLEEVLRGTGTGAGVRNQGFGVPAAGKTGTSRDGWFAGYTTELLCVVWVGFDDNRDLDLEGAKSAAPIWGEFMKRALAFREYRDAQEFTAPEGVVSVEIDPLSGMPATPACPKVYSEVYIAGTEPVGTCALHGGHGGVTNVAGWDTGGNPANAADGTPTGGSREPAPPVARRAARQASAAQAAQAAPPSPPPGPQPQKPEEKKSLLRRLLGVFK